MEKTFDNLSEEQANLVVLKVLCILEDEKYRKIYNWPLEDISIDDLFKQIQKIYLDNNLKNNFIKFCLNHIDKKKQYSLIEGFFNLIMLFEYLERYEDCIVLKNIKDKILLDMQYS
tara:strand:+ start:187 stop:534 length:348 start_codon:yes stop_codon:yes gene_type:complete